jgi:hypothetical protein
MALTTFPFRFHPVFRAVALPLGIRSDTARVEVADEHLSVVFGRWRLRTPLDNVEGVRVTGPFAWPKVIGPPHLSFADRGLTFATNPHEGVCIDLSTPEPGLDPWGILRHPGVTVTVEDTAGLVEMLGGGPGRVSPSRAGTTP